MVAWLILLAVCAVVNAALIAREVESAFDEGFHGTTRVDDEDDDLPWAGW